MTAAEITGVLGGRGRMTRCPAHEDRSPSLRITASEDRILVYCHAGCAQAEVIAALRSPRPPGERAHFAGGRLEARRIRSEAAYFADAAAVMPDWALEKISPTDPERARPTALLVGLRVSPEAGYRARLEQQPIWAAALVCAGRERAKRLQVAMARWIAAGMQGVAGAA